MNALELLNGRIIPGAMLLSLDNSGFWWNRIDLDRLDSGSETNSVLGQLYGTRSEGLAALKLTEAEADGLGLAVDVERFGMSADTEAIAHELLTLAWADLIRGLVAETPAEVAA